MKGIMMAELKNTDKLNPDAASKINPYMEEFLRVHGESIVSIFIYGSAASGDYVKGSSDINSAIVFKKIGMPELKQSLRTVNRGIRHRINTPLFLTKEHVVTSLDTFPIEFIEMKENHVVLYGEDILSGISVDLSHIRFVCEEQIKGKLLRIRQGYLEIGLRKKGIESLIKESFTSLFPAFRGLLRLKGIMPFKTKKENIKALGDAFGIDTEILFAILADKRNDGKISGQDLESALFKYIEQLEKLGDIADQLR
jgi:predicted nucleotidyltransferase